MQNGAIAHYRTYQCIAAAEVALLVPILCTCCGVLESLSDCVIVVSLLRAQPSISGAIERLQRCR